MKTSSKLIKAFGLLVISVTLLTGCQIPANKTEGTGTSQTTVAEAKETETGQLDLKDAQTYLKTYFDVTFSDEVTKVEINQASEKIFGKEALQVDGELSGLSLIKLANQLGDYDELALSYGTEKVQASLKKAGITTKLDEKVAAYVASTIDTNLLDNRLAKELVEGKKITGDQATKLMMGVVNVRGLGRNYLGMSNDPSIYQKIEDSFKSFVLFKDAELADFGSKAVKDEVVTGYNLKLNSYDANFLPETTFIYGHSDIRHAHQLMGLLNSEGFEVKVQLEPKVSVFQYLLEWGPIPEPKPTYFVETIGDLHLVNAVEYDLALEFSNQKEMERFDQVIESYAKKNEGNEEGKGLIAASWWQPFIKTVNQKLPADRFYQVFDCSINTELYSMHSIALKEDKDKVENSFNEMKSKAEIKIEEKYCNLAFYNYLQGKDYQ